MHIGFIVDGNRRWAKAHNLPAIEGHRAGMKAVEMTITELAKRPEEVDYATFYVFSTENWGRSREEVDNLMALASKEIERLAAKMAKNNIKLIVLGSEERISPELLQKLRAAEAKTAACTGLTVCFCFNYGGRQEIADAAKALALDYKNLSHAAVHDPTQKMPKLDELCTPDNLSKYIYHPEIPDLDLIVRSSGEQRISGFMLWRAAYAEFLFLDQFYPDLTEADIANILTEYTHRNRRYGK